MKAIVSGGTGFIGRALVNELLSRGIEVYVITRTRGKAKKIFGEIGEILPNEDYPQADVLFNLAGAVKGKKYEDFRKANVGLVKEILDKAAGKVNKIVHLSSQAAGGPSFDCKPVKEQANRPVSLYGKSKLEGERVVKNFNGNWAILRPPAVFGEGDYAFIDLYKTIKKGFAPWLGPRKLTMIYIKDLVWSIIKAWEKVNGEIVNVGTKDPVDYWDFVENVGKLLGRKKIKKIPIPIFAATIVAFFSETFTHTMFTMDKIREIKYPCWILDVKRAEDLGILRETPMLDALKSTLTWAIETGKL